MLNLAMISALNRPNELRTHVKAALTNGVTRDEIREVFLQVAIYAGVPAAVDSFRIAGEAFAELDRTPGKDSATDGDRVYRAGQHGLSHGTTPYRRHHDVVVFDTQSAALQRAVALGAQAAASSKEVADRAEPSWPACRRRRLAGSGDRGRGRDRGLAGQALVDLSTVGSRTAVQIHDLLAATHHRPIDSPVSGGVSGAEKGALAIMVSGPRHEFDFIRTALDASADRSMSAKSPGRRRR